MTPWQRSAAEFTGSAALVMAVVGSGIMGEQLSAGNAAVALLANTVATAAALFVLIAIFQPVSGAHFNPIVTVREAALGRLGAGTGLQYVAAQTLGAAGGVALAHAMFGQALLQWGSKPRGGVGQWLGEILATAGLVFAIERVRDRPAEVIAAVVAAWIAGAYWFTSSTSFANPAVTLARAMTASFAGIAVGDVPGFLLAQAIGGLAGHALARAFATAGPSRSGP